MIGLIDADHIPYIVCYNKQDEPEKTLEECINGANNYLQGLINGSNILEFNLFFTVGKNFRYEIYPEYKANRAKSEKPPFFNEVKDYLINTYNGIYGHNLEADDLLCIYKKKCIDESIPYIVISTDKDINNLEGTHYDIKNNVIVNIDKQFAEEYFWKSIVIGDTADNIKGLPGKGPAFVKKILEESNDINTFKARIMYEYLRQFGEEKGVNEFYKNYKCLKIKDELEGIEFLKPINVKEVYAKTLGMVGE